MKRTLHGFGGKLRHEVPSWARDDALYHVRIRCEPTQHTPLTAFKLAEPLIDSVRRYEEQGRWWVNIFLLMPDHLHALLAFPPNEKLSTVIGSWKRFHARSQSIRWQENYFDHRLRDHDTQWDHKREYILNNPVVVGFCAKPEDWPWRYESQGGAPETRPGQRVR